jgi:LPS sulfotransferase NodH
MPAYYPILRSNPHLDVAKQLFGDRPTPAFTPAAGMQFVFICYTNRCGSNLVAELIGSDGRYPVACEDLNRKAIVPFAHSKRACSFGDYFTKLVEARAKNGVFLVKTLPAHLGLLGAYGILDQIIDRSHFILVERSDKLGQAISLAIALQTGAFTSRHKAKLTAEETAFSATGVTEALRFICQSHLLFDEFFGFNGLVPVHIVYEQLLADPQRVVGDAAASCGLAGLHVQLDGMRLQRQANAINSQWRDLYLNAVSPGRRAT